MSKGADRLTPDTRRLAPAYEQTDFNIAELKNNLLPVVSKKLHKLGEVAYINQDLTIDLSDFIQTSVLC